MRVVEVACRAGAGRCDELFATFGRAGAAANRALALRGCATLSLVAAVALIAILGVKRAEADAGNALQIASPSAAFRIDGYPRDGGRAWPERTRQASDGKLRLADAVGAFDGDRPSPPVAEPPDYRMGDFRSAVPATLAGARVVDTRAAEVLWRAGAHFVDVLPRPPRPKLPLGTLWREPKRDDIPGSIWLPNTGFGALSPEAEAYFRAGLKAASGGDPAAPLVFYCLSDCWMSWNAARRALAAGHTDVGWYPFGTDGWAAAGLPLAAAEAFPGEPAR